MASEMQEITGWLVKFRDDRNWKQFHNSKDLVLALSIEAAELNELFLWKKPEEVNVAKLREELADVLAYSFLLAANHNLNVKEIIRQKIAVNSEKYPIDKAKDTAKKYDEL
jgi:NTP pyrophosphatase (non-canonical NTP hydrolase)